MPRKAAKTRKRTPGERFSAVVRIIENSPQVLIAVELYDTWRAGEFTPMWLSLRGHMLQLDDTYVSAAPVIVCILLILLSQCRKAISRQWFWAASCDVGWISLSALMVVARPHALAVKLCLIVFVLLFFRHVPWAKFFRKSKTTKAKPPEIAEDPAAQI